MATQALATVDDVISRAKEFTVLATVNPPTSTSAEISLALADATMQVNVNVWGPLARLAQTYLAAHFLSSRNPQLCEPAGPVSRDTVGEQDSHYAVAAGPITEADYSSSRWGRAYVTLQRQIARSHFLVT